VAGKRRKIKKISIMVGSDAEEKWLEKRRKIKNISIVVGNDDEEKWLQEGGK
jgi:hypothetical protein